MMKASQCCVPMVKYREGPNYRPPDLTDDLVLCNLCKPPKKRLLQQLSTEAQAEAAMLQGALQLLEQQIAMKNLKRPPKKNPPKMADVIARTGRVQSWLDDPTSRLPVGCTVVCR